MLQTRAVIHGARNHLKHLKHPRCLRLYSDQGPPRPPGPGFIWNNLSCPPTKQELLPKRRPRRGVGVGVGIGININNSINSSTSTTTSTTSTSTSTTTTTSTSTTTTATTQAPTEPTPPLLPAPPTPPTPPTPPAMSLPRTLLRTPRTIACIGRNYADHVKELNNTAPATPFYFLKPPSALLHPNAGPVLAPRGVNLHYEVELAAVMGRTADDLTPETALDAVKGWCVAIDMTARNYQEAAKAAGLPWTLCKGFKTFLPVSRFIPKALLPDPQNAELYLSVNGEMRQQDSTALMLFAVPRLLHHVTSVAPLYEDDLVLTGTPKGVGRVVAGDVMRAGIRVGGREIEEGRIEVAVEDRVGGFGAADEGGCPTEGGGNTWSWT